MIRKNEVTANGTDPRKDSGVELENSDKNVVNDNMIRDNIDGLVDEIRCQRGSDDNDGDNVTRRCR
jgi:hypothetical protein